MLYAIYAYEDTFGGLHGINSFAVVEASSNEEAETIAAEMSRDVIDSYGYTLGYDEDYDDDDEIHEEDITEHIAYEIYPFIEDTMKSLDELNEEFQNDPNDFLKKYCNAKIGFYF